MSYKSVKCNQKYTLIKELKHWHCQIMKEIRKCKIFSQVFHTSAFEEEKWSQLKFTFTVQKQVLWVHDKITMVKGKKN